jgi:hypothetical protein
MTRTGLHDLFIGWFDYYAARATARLDGLTDEEQLWEPVPGCWTVRPSGDTYIADHASPPPDPAPVTTIAWRLAHLSSMLTEHRLRAVAFGLRPADARPQPPISPVATEALATFARSLGDWRDDLVRVTEERLWEPMGAGAGPFSEDLAGSFVEHVHDELIHHTAEIALLRDLYRWRPIS